MPQEDGFLKQWTDSFVQAYVNIYWIPAAYLIYETDSKTYDEKDEITNR